MTTIQEHPLEALKRESRCFRGALAEELQLPETGFSKDSEQLLKPHGLYQQRDRDLRGQNPPHTFLLRGRIPGGRLTASAYLAWDALADRYGDGTLRLTTRQSIELHGVLKGDLKATIAGLARALQTTQGACGDVVRNVTQAPNPWGRADLAALDGVAQALSDHFKARSNAYAELWLDGEKVDLGRETEPFYGEVYLPRKFKIGVTAVGENLIDLYTNDLAFAATFEGANLTGYHVFAGGGMGMTHGKPETYPRLADHLGWVPAEALMPVAEAVVGSHRDLGHRGDRKQARLKYVVARLGSEAYRAEVERRAGLAFELRPLPDWQTTPVLGWLPRVDGTWAYGLHAPAGRCQGALKAALRVAVATYGLSVQISPDQDLILLGIASEDREAVQSMLSEAGAQEADPLSRRALACVALPLCSLAITEAERVLPEVLANLRQALERHGRLDRAPVFRITGCANGCARPYAAELALVGQGAGVYVLYAGGSPEGTRLAQPVSAKVRLGDLPELFEGLVAAWASAALPDECFGDWADRLGPAELQARLSSSP